jgi:hypothetical protein
MAKIIVVLEVVDVPEELKEHQQTPETIHELLCKAIHEGDQDARDMLETNVTDIAVCSIGQHALIAELLQDHICACEERIKQEALPDELVVKMASEIDAGTELQRILLPDEMAEIEDANKAFSAHDLPDTKN